MAADDRLIIVSGDCHADPGSVREYGPYLEAEYQEDFEAYVATVEKSPGSHEELFSAENVRRKDEAAEFEGFTEEEAAAARRRLRTGKAYTTDPAVRLKELEADGVACEIMFPNGAPFAGFGARSDRDRELQAAGMRAYNRWLAELCQAHPGRRIGVAQFPPAFDVDASVEYLHWIKESGLGAVMCPSSHRDLPPLIDAYYEPIWTAIEELELPMHAHVGWGGAGVDQVSFRAPGEGVDYHALAITAMEIGWLSQRALWVMIWGGMFDRHPGLKLVFVEQGCVWIPPLLARMDAMATGFAHSDQFGSLLSLKPSEYYERQCFVTASMIRRSEVDQRDRIGTSTMMFGTDYPHMEASWPHSKQWVTVALDGVAEPEIRMILGDNAIRCYNLDRPQLQHVADQIGPRVGDFTGARERISPQVSSLLDDLGVSAPAVVK